MKDVRQVAPAPSLADSRKTEVARGCAQNCYQGLQEARGDAALPYCTVA
jgi:hypothetical protein